MTLRLLRTFALALTLAGCAAAQQPVQARPVADAPQRLATETLRIETSARPLRFVMEVAATPETRERGLMFRRSMRDDHGMIFDFRTPQVVSFWMENTFIPLDMLFVAEDGRVLNIAKQAIPHDRRPIPSAGPIRAVIEINGGLADKLGIRPGDQVRDQRVFGGG